MRNESSSHSNIQTLTYGELTPPDNARTNVAICTNMHSVRRKSVRFERLLSWS
jgi:hypothetical protein